MPDKEYYKRKNKENYQKRKEMSKKYHSESFGNESYTEFCRRMKKVKKI